MNLGATNSVLSSNAGLGRFPDITGSGFYDFSAMGMAGSMGGIDNSMSLINDYELGRTSREEPLTLQDSSFDIMSWVNDMDTKPDDELTALGGGAV